MAEQRRKQGQQASELVLFSGGGTGGHVYPGLAVLDRVRELHGVEVAWVGGSKGIERDIVARHGVRYHGIPAGKLRRYLSLRNVVDLFRVIAGVVRSISLVRALRPALLFSKGGFVSVPPVIAARLLRVPVISHESDSDPGLATRINARFSSSVLVPYEATRDLLPAALRSRVVVTGNPLRPEILAGRREKGLGFVGFDPDDPRPVALFLGGSLGAVQLNELVRDLGPGVADSWRVIHQSGDHRVARVNDAGYFAAAFFRDELADVLAAADVIVCRAGASTLWEGAALAKPMLLVPLSSGSRGDQIRNAAVFERGGGARVFTTAATLAEDIRRALADLADNADLRREMGLRAQGVIRLDATELIVDRIAAHLWTPDEIAEERTEHDVCGH